MPGPEIRVGAGGACHLLDSPGVIPPARVPVISPGKRRRRHDPARGTDRSRQFRRLHLRERQCVPQLPRQQIRLSAQPIQRGGNLTQDLPDRMHIGRYEVHPATGPPYMPARDSDRPHQLLDFADKLAAAREILSAPRHRSLDREPPALDDQTLRFEPRQAADQLVRGQVTHLNRGVDRAGVVVEANAARFEEDPVLDSTRSPRPAQRQRPLQLVEHRALVGLVAVQLETRIPEVDRVQPALHDLQGGHLLGHEEDLQVTGERFADQVGDRL